MSGTDSKVEQMFKLLLDPEEKDQEKKQKVANLERWEPRAVWVHRVKVISGEGPISFRSSFFSMTYKSQVCLLALQSQNSN